MKRGSLLIQLKPAAALVAAVLSISMMGCNQGGNKPEAEAPVAASSSAETPGVPSAQSNVAPAGPLSQAGTSASGSGASGTIDGTVIYSGSAPAPHTIDVTKDKEVCGLKPHFDESLAVASSGGLANAVVSIADNSTPPPAPQKNPQLIQQGCTYLPHVLAIPAGATLDVQNEDGILHNIHTYSTLNPPVNIAQPKFKKLVQIQFTQPEVIKVNCDAHGWMNAWLFVAKNPYYAVTDADGHFTIANVPPGDYTLEAWQEKLGKSQQHITVKPGETAKVVFKFAAS